MVPDYSIMLSVGRKYRWIIIYFWADQYYNENIVMKITMDGHNGYKLITYNIM